MSTFEGDLLLDKCVINQDLADGLRLAGHCWLGLGRAVVAVVQPNFLYLHLHLVELVQGEHLNLIGGHVKSCYEIGGFDVQVVLLALLVAVVSRSDIQLTGLLRWHFQ